MSWNIDLVFDLVLERSPSDIVFIPGSPPAIWVAGRMQLIDAPPVASTDVEGIFFGLLSDEQRRHLEETGDLDFSVGRRDVGRFRINLHRQRTTWAAAMRFIPGEVPAFEQLKLPDDVLRLADLPRGLVLITGGTGAGKSTTLAAMVEYMNQNYAYHIITLEDPIEFTFRHKCSLIEQREIGVDCPTFASALRNVVRQKPDVILVGEMRDLETISAALTAAETGHLVLASLHTVNAVETVNRIIDVFSAEQQSQIRMQLSDTLQGVVCQTLFHDEIDDKMVPAIEILIATPAVRRAIRDRETHLVAGMIETGRGAGMQAMDASIASLVKAGRITAGDAMASAQNPERLARLITKVGVS